MPSYLSEGQRHFQQVNRISSNDPISKLDYYLNTSSSSPASSSSWASVSSSANLKHCQANGRYRFAGGARKFQGSRVQKSSSSASSSTTISGHSSYSARLISLLRKQSHENPNDTARQQKFQEDGSDFDERLSLDRLRHRLPPKAMLKNVPPQKAKNGSPLETSGFSEGTVVEPTFYYDSNSNNRKHNNLNDRNLVSFSLHGTANTNPFVGQFDSNNIHSNNNRFIRRSDSQSVDQFSSDGTKDSSAAATTTKHYNNNHSSLSRKQVAVAKDNLARNKLTPMRRSGGHAGGGNNFDRLKRRKINRNKRMVVIGEDQNPYMLGNPYALSELFSQSEIPGFREIFASDSYLRKFCWIVAFLFMTVLSLNDMTELITEYYDYPITVDVRLRDSARLPFPAVTVCNLNAVRFSSLCSNSRHDLTQQIPSELRDKLCGIQVEKNKNKNSNNNNSDSSDDIGDINNIGVTTTTTTTTTTTPSPPTTTTVASTLITENSTTINDSLVSKNKNSSLADENGLGPEHKLQQQQQQQHPQSDLLRRMSIKRTRANQQQQQQNTAGRIRERRSIQVNENTNGDDQARPFVSQRSRVRVKQAQTQAAQQGGDGQAQKNRLQFASQSPPTRPNTRIPPPLSSAPAVAPGQPFNVPIRGQLPNTPNGPQGQPPQPGGQPSVGGGNSFPPANAAQPPGGSNNNRGGGGGGDPSQPNQVTNFNPISSLPEDFELTERQERELQENLTNWLAVMYQRDAQLTRSLGHQFDDMILRCTMKSINCTRQRSFENSFSPTEGNCFTYRSRMKRKSTTSSSTLSSLSQRQQNAFSNQWEESNLAGTNDGLELVLNLEKNEYISGSSQVGALVMIHHPNDLGYAASEATFIAPEFTTYIGLKMVNITRLPAPYPESCVDSWPAKFADTLTRNSTYSQQACLKICLQKTIQANCQCQSAFLPIVEAPTTTPASPQNQSSSAPTTSTNSKSTINQQPGEQQPPPQQQQQQQRVIICDTRKQATRLCVRDINLRTSDRVHKCECPPKCQVVRYDKTISMARWPTREDKVSFDRGKTDVSFQNLAKVIVYFQTMTCEEVSQQAVFNAAKLFSALGGIMGMYVGFSFLSVFEIVEVISRKFWHYCTGRLCRTTTRLMNNYHA